MRVLAVLFCDLSAVRTATRATLRAFVQIAQAWCAGRGQLASIIRRQLSFVAVRCALIVVGLFGAYCATKQGGVEQPIPTAGESYTLLVSNACEDAHAPIEPEFSEEEVADDETSDSIPTVPTLQQSTDHDSDVEYCRLVTEIGSTATFCGSSVNTSRFRGHAVVLSEADEPLVVLPGTPPSLVL
jgi:hypothetical protein